ncbi:MAG: Fic family protein [Nanoarchaeota archaeon]|nr:Fic family protein [Nanoarchaeota archaeon]
MKITKEELLRINRGFGGGLRDDSSLDYAIDKLDDKKIGDYKKVAYLMRAILVDHPFSDGNKRTAAYAVLSFATEMKKSVDMDLLLHHIVSIAKQNIHEINKIEWRMRNAIR